MTTEGPTQYGVFWEPSSSEARGPDWENALLYFKNRDIGEWTAHFGRDPDVLLKLLGNIFKAVSAEEAKRLGQPRPRRQAPEGGILNAVQPMIQPRYSQESFPEALEELRDGRPEPYLAFCTRIGIPRRTLDHMRSGRNPLSMYWMDRIARDYGVGPEFFREYREMVILMAVHRFVQDHPAFSIGFVRKVRGFA